MNQNREQNQDQTQNQPQELGRDQIEICAEIHFNHNALLSFRKKQQWLNGNMELLRDIYDHGLNTSKYLKVKDFPTFCEFMYKYWK
jgi:hypothetical protein